MCKFLGFHRDVIEVLNIPILWRCVPAVETTDPATQHRRVTLVYLTVSFCGAVPVIELFFSKRLNCEYFSISLSSIGKTTKTQWALPAGQGQASAWYLFSNLRTVHIAPSDSWDQAAWKAG